MRNINKGSWVIAAAVGGVLSMSAVGKAVADDGSSTKRPQLALADDGSSTKRPQLALADDGSSTKRPQLALADDGSSTKRPQRNSLSA
jgi:hypothetical protein